MEGLAFKTLFSLAGGFFSFIFPALFLFSALGWGRALAGVVRFKFEDSVESFALQALVGMGVTGYLLFFLGVPGLFYPIVIGAIPLTGLLLILRYPIRIKPEFSPKIQAFLGDRFSLAFSVLALVALGAALLRLNVPAATSDEVSYHLYLPKIFLLRHEIFFWPYHVNSAFPQLGDLLYTFGVILRQPVAYKGVHFIFGFLTALSLYGISRTVLPKIPAWWAPFVFLSTPIVTHQMALANNDLMLTAYLTGSYLCLFRWAKEKQAPWLALAGALSGFALGVKYLAVLALMVQVIFILVEGMASKMRPVRVFRALALFSFFALMISAVWYWRSFRYTGNPIYPYLTGLFGGVGLENPLSLEGKGFGKDWKALLLLSWNMTFSPQAFGGTGNQWGPLYLAFLPWVFLIRRKNRTVKLILFITAATLLLWFYAKQNLRFLLPGLPFFCLLAVLVLDFFRRKERGLSYLASGAFLFFLFLHAGIALFPLRQNYRVALGLERQANYLRRTEPSYGPAEFLNQKSGARTFKILSQEHRAFYFEGEVVRERAYRRLTHYPEKYKGRERDFYRGLINEGFTHLLIQKSKAAEPVDLLERMLADEKPVYETSFKDKGLHEERRYRLYELRIS